MQEYQRALELLGLTRSAKQRAFELTDVLLASVFVLLYQCSSEQSVSCFTSSNVLHVLLASVFVLLYQCSSEHSVTCFTNVLHGSR
jgi:hypothetical protein